MVPCENIGLLNKQHKWQPAPLQQIATEKNPMREKSTHLLCAACRYFITWETSHTEINGTHAHTFTNPVGLVYHIGCFTIAPGCSTQGQATTEHSWFPGFAWQTAFCGNCQQHIGWRFASFSAVFHALIMDRLINESHGDQ